MSSMLSPLGMHAKKKGLRALSGMIGDQDGLLTNDIATDANKIFLDKMAVDFFFHYKFFSSFYKTVK